MATSLPTNLTDGQAGAIAHHNAAWDAINDLTAAAEAERSLTLVPGYSTITAAESVNRVMYNFAWGTNHTIDFHNIPAPRDIAPGTAVKVRLLWYAENTTGDTYLTLGVRKLGVSGDDVTVGQTDTNVLATVPGTANRSTTTTITSAVTVSPGDWIAIRLQRKQDQATDTNDGGFRFLGAELIYARAY